jgi:hypothetical protein
MSDKISTFYGNRHLIFKEICNHVKNILFILKKQKNEIEIRQIHKSLKNYENK